MTATAKAPGSTLGAALAISLLMAGCAALQPDAPVEPAPEPQKPQVIITPPAPQPQPRIASEAEALLSYFAHLRKLGGTDLAREHEAARQAYGRARSDYNGMRLALVMVLPNTPYSDEPRALELLEPIARNGEGRLAGLASLLASQIQERRRLDLNAQALQQKLDALKSLERSLIERKSERKR